MNTRSRAGWYRRCAKTAWTPSSPTCQSVSSGTSVPASRSSPAMKVGSSAIPAPSRAARRNASALDDCRRTTGSINSVAPSRVNGQPWNAPNAKRSATCCCRSAGRRGIPWRRRYAGEATGSRRDVASLRPASAVSRRGATRTATSTPSSTRSTTRLENRSSIDSSGQAASSGATIGAMCTSPSSVGAVTRSVPLGASA